MVTRSTRRKGICLCSSISIPVRQGCEPGITYSVVSGTSSHRPYFRHLADDCDHPHTSAGGPRGLEGSRPRMADDTALKAYAERHGLVYETGRPVTVQTPLAPTTPSDHSLTGTLPGGSRGRSR